MRDLIPATEYTIRLASNNRYGRSDGVLVTQATLHGVCLTPLRTLLLETNLKNGITLI